MTPDYGNNKYHSYTAITGTSANAYPGTAQAQWAHAFVYNGYKTIYIENTDSTNSITVKVSAKPSPNDAFEGLVKDDNGSSEPAIAAAAFALFNISEACHTINIFVKSTVEDSHGTFKIIASGYMK